MPSKSPAQHRFMEAVAHNPAFARKVGVATSVGKDFVSADKFAVGGPIRIQAGNTQLRLPSPTIMGHAKSHIVNGAAFRPRWGVQRRPFADGGSAQPASFQDIMDSVATGDNPNEGAPVANAIKSGAMALKQRYQPALDAAKAQGWAKTAQDMGAGVASGAISSTLSAPGDVEKALFPSEPNVFPTNEQVRSRFPTYTPNSAAVYGAGQDLGSVLPVSAAKAATVAVKAAPAMAGKAIFVAAKPEIAAAADEMVKNGINHDAIKEATNLVQDGDGNWMHVISDHNMRYTPPSRSAGAQPLSSIVQHPEVFDAVPQMRDWQVVAHTPDEIEGIAGPGTDAYASTTNKTIGIREDLAQDDPRARNIMLHEMQHIAQDEGNLPVGTTVGSYGKYGTDLVNRANAALHSNLKARGYRGNYVNDWDAVPISVVHEATGNIYTPQTFPPDVQKIIEQTTRMKTAQSPYNAYRNTAGEAWARLTERLGNTDLNGMSATDIKSRFDVPENKHIYIYPQ